MQTFNRKILFIALFFALSASVLIYSYLSQLKKPEEKIEYVNVAVAVKTIEKRAVIGANEIKNIKIEKQYANPKAVADASEIIGKRAQEKIIEGEQVLRDRVVSKENMLLAYGIPEGKRAITVNVNEAMEVGDFIRPGDYVDILATFDKYEVEEGKSKITYPRMTRIILQDVLILGMGQLAEVPEKPRAELPKTVTLAVTPSETEKLFYSAETGVLKMTLRRTGEHDISPAPGVIREDLINDKGKRIVDK